MWLLNTNGSLVLTDFVDQELEPNGLAWRPDYDYAILSHRWEDTELTFDEIRAADFSPHKYISRYKIDKCLEQARTDSLGWAWIDTCCIDKRSSAELQESLNSMYRWYERATVCYVYLRDVHLDDFETSFVDSEWFKRGWTLPELLAPATVKFYDAEWLFLGDKSSLSDRISLATGISSEIIEGHYPVRQCSIAQKMSWAANRETSRVEDRAYSLLGIFDVTMPMMYGEGEKAFIRLQEEIIKSSDDHSIFAWSGIQPRHPGLLATSPEAFRDSSDIEVVRLRSARQPYSITNRGVSITLALTPWTVDSYLAVINCARTAGKAATDSPQMGIFLRRLYEDDQYARVAINGDELVENALPHDTGAAAETLLKTIHVRQIPLLPGDEYFLVDRVYGFRLNEALLEKDNGGNDLYEVRILGKQQGYWDASRRTVIFPYGCGPQNSVCFLNIGKQMRNVVLIKLAFDDDFSPVVFLVEAQLVEKADKLTDNINAMKWTPILSPREASKARSYSWTKPGLWAYKADRIYGLDTYIQDPTDPTANGTHVQFKRGDMNDSLVWDVIVEGLKGSGKKRSFFGSDKKGK